MRNHAVRTSRGLEPGLAAYFEEINRIDLLSHDEELELAERVKVGDASAVDRLVAANLRFVVSIARRYENKGVPLEDLISEGNLGLVRAAHRYDAERGYKFISYAVWWIRQAILNSLSQNARIVRLPANKVAALNKIAKAKRALRQELGHEPSKAEIAARLGMSEAQVERVTGSSISHVSLDANGWQDPDGRALVEQLVDTRNPAPDEGTAARLLSEATRRAMNRLAERERVILTLYFGLDESEPLTLEQIGERLGLTRERIRQLKEKALDHLRTAVEHRQADHPRNLASH